MCPPLQDLVPNIRSYGKMTRASFFLQTANLLEPKLTIKRLSQSWHFDVSKKSKIAATTGHMTDSIEINVLENNLTVSAE